PRAREEFQMARPFWRSDESPIPTRRNSLRAQTSSRLRPQLLEKDSAPQKNLRPKPARSHPSQFLVLSLLTPQTIRLCRTPLALQHKPVCVDFLLPHLAE